MKATKTEILIARILYNVDKYARSGEIVGLRGHLEFLQNVLNNPGSYVALPPPPVVSKTLTVKPTSC